MSEELQISAYGDTALPTLVYLPGLHGDWTLVGAFRAALAGRLHFIVVTYPRSLTWSIQDYANTIEAELLNRGVTHGWLLGESFGSQVAWEILAKQLQREKSSEPPPHKNSFFVEGLILAGGFVKHPWKWGPGTLRWIGRRTPDSMVRLQLKVYAWYSKFRHRHAPEVLNTIGEFVRRRTVLDRQAMGKRLSLLDHYDPRPVAKRARIPVYYLAGLIDPLVPWVLVRRWLQKNCPGYKGGKTFWLADHNVLATASRQAADAVIDWMQNSASKQS